MGRRRAARTENVSGALEADIVEGRLKPGDHLDERGLSERFGVSRTPIREALQRLAATGLIREKDGQGCIVARITLPDLFAMFELVNELEKSAARFAAQRIDEPTSCLLMKAAETCVAVAQGGDKLAYSKSNLDFHGIIYRASRNHFLENTIQQVSARAAIYRRQALTLPDWAMRSAAEHLEIARAITSHDHVRAESLMAHHINIFGRPDFPRFVVLLSEQLETATFPPPIATRA